MYQKRVKLTQYGLFSEVDPIALHRTATALKAYIKSKLTPDNDPYDIKEQALPLCVGVLEHRLSLPLDFYSFPLKHPEREGFLPEDFVKPWKAFRIEATGIDEMLSEPVVIDGEKYCERIFEEPGDWPEKIGQWADERRRQRMGADYVPVTR